MAPEELSSTRYIAHDNEPPSDLEATRKTILEALTAAVERVERHYAGTHHTTGSVYVGVEGIILMNHHIRHLPGAKSVDALASSTLDKNSRRHLNAAILHSRIAPPRTCSRSSFLETSIGTATLVLLYLLGSSSPLHYPKNWETCVNAISGALRLASREEMSEDGCEVLYGRAGLLYALLRLRSALPKATREQVEVVRAIEPLVADTSLTTLVDDIVERGAAGAKEYAHELNGNGPPLMWSWHGKRYLGGAHGVAGILQILLQCPSSTIKPHREAIAKTLEWLIGIQCSDGNWPHKASIHPEIDPDEDMVQYALHPHLPFPSPHPPFRRWCHGAPAVLILISTFLRRARTSKTLGAALSAHPDLEPSILSAARKAAELVYRRGFLRKGVGLCHGVGGSVYALLAASQILDTDTIARDADEQRDGGGEEGGEGGETLRKAAHLALLAADWAPLTEEGVMSTPDRPWSLYEGAAGMCCAWADLLRALAGKEVIGMPGYADIQYSR
ncbi:hypothetical protein PUNSTDRAFT_138330 [Punctularia strigosozonata HHB-11173 SS5]|uniref:Lanthionine synthetase C family protein n=1 Tax=Punctularia strigosozonata (strain HHB-11173) TaxID=741275 RepID=R7S2S7_PUNST|nr:uncharacterized protein PUNSTDRAFT_138330 [Punctularia strigosozonata HHB-11173 SS5]EIN04685.1 hypothetical protein PUNSTDRAFT_138330 [Punctularia strigosozonata HHB-11173 SS5]